MARFVKRDRSGRTRAQVHHLEVGDVLLFGGRKAITSIARIEHAELNPEWMAEALAYEGWDAFRMVLDDGTVKDVPAFCYYFLAADRPR
ncbi:hypothetical protein [Streptomyces sp. NRRL B-24484]|uniref:hypothetical protein n=1 Tax=Streptomyces sp. NRRL B-24484 TaxID=1463833 RepID=UPI0004C26DCF|nr:hypothetical protein [Streptomyces sp. NRRL B-24484]